MPTKDGSTKAKKKTTRRTPKKSLVIVESPSKAKTIEKYLGNRYKVMASLGHIRDLPKSKMGIDVENNYEPHYISIRGKGDVIKELRKEAKKPITSILQPIPTVKEKQLHGIFPICWDWIQRTRIASYLMKLRKMRLKTPSRLRVQSI